MRARAAAGASLRQRQGELEQEALAKIHADPAAPTPDAEYAVGLRAAVAAALDCGLEVLEGRDPDSVPIPAALLLQARLAAQAGIEFEVVACRYSAGHTLLTNAIVGELANDGALRSEWLQRLLVEQGALLERVLALVSEEYRLEVARRERPRSRQHLLVRKLLAGQQVDPAGLRYDLDAWHIGVVASGPDREDALRDLTKQLDRQLLLLDRDGATTWAWFGGRRRIGSDEFEQAASTWWPPGALLTIGEPARDLPGWRLSHHQARAIVTLVRRGSRQVARYADHPFVASMLQDNLLIQSVRQIFLAPLEEERDEGRELRRTLRAYFAASGNVSSTANALRVQRKTVKTRLARAEERIGRPLSACSFEIEAALALDRVLAGE